MVYVSYIVLKAVFNRLFNDNDSTYQWHPLQMFFISEIHLRLDLISHGFISYLVYQLCFFDILIF